MLCVDINVCFSPVDPPTIVTQPSNLTVTASEFQLSVEATGVGLTFQWQRVGLGLNIFDTPGLYNGTNTTTLTVLNVLTAADGDNEIDFSVSVSNPAALILSETATVTVCE